MICTAAGYALVSTVCDFMLLKIMFCTSCMLLKIVVLPKFSKRGDCCFFWIECIMQNNNEGLKLFWSTNAHAGTDVPTCVMHLSLICRTMMLICAHIFQFMEWIFGDVCNTYCRCFLAIKFI